MAVVLLVEDEIESQQLIGLMLSTAGYEVMTAADGARAIQVVKEHDVDAVVTDLKMPIMNGLRLIKALRGLGDTIPILAISGHNKDQLMMAEDLGANAALAKPIDRDELISVLERVIKDTQTDWSSAWIHPEFGKVGER